VKGILNLCQAVARSFLLIRGFPPGRRSSRVAQIKGEFNRDPLKTRAMTLEN